MNIASTKQNWWKNALQRIQVIFGPKRLSLSKPEEKLCENNIEIPEQFNFEEIVNIYNLYTLKGAGKSGKANKTIIEKATLEEITDDILLQKLEFVSIWRKSAAGNLADENDEIALPICFNQEAKETYNKISKYAIMHLLKYGHIDTKEILDITKNMEYKWSRQTARKLFKNAVQAQIVTDFYRLATPNAKEQTKKTLTTDQALYGLEI